MAKAARKVEEQEKENEQMTEENGGEVENGGEAGENGNGDGTSPTPPAATASSAKKQKASITYITSDGEVLNFPAKEGIIVRTTFANDMTRDIDIAKVPEDMRHCAMLQGLAIRTQRAYNAIKDIDAVIESYDETVGDIMAGVWIESRAGEPKVALLTDAVVASLVEMGEVVDDARKAAILEKLKDTEAEYRSKAEKNPQVQKHLARLRAEAATKRAAEAADNATKNSAAPTVASLGF